MLIFPCSLGRNPIRTRRLCKDGRSSSCISGTSQSSAEEMGEDPRRMYRTYDKDGNVDEPLEYNATDDCGNNLETPQPLGASGPDVRNKLTGDLPIGHSLAWMRSTFSERKFANILDRFVFGSNKTGTHLPPIRATDITRTTTHFTASPKRWATWALYLSFQKYLVKFVQLPLEFLPSSLSFFYEENVWNRVFFI